MSKPAHWKNRKYPKRKYKGSYGTESKTRSRAFILVQDPPAASGRNHAVAFESHEAAKQAGWKKLK